MNIDELIKYRVDLLENSVNGEGYISQQTFLEAVLPSIVETGLTESEEINIMPPNQNFNILGYTENESGERLQLFIVDSDSISLTAKKEALIHSRKDHHNANFKQAREFVNKAIKGHTDDLIQDSDPLAVLANQLFSSSFIDRIDVIEIILFSATVAAETRGKENDIKKFEFEDSSLNVKITKNRESVKKELDIYYKLVDLAYLNQISISKGNAHPLKVSFKDTFGSDIEVLKAADEEHFESYLCVLPAVGLASLYKKESSRLLEKNVRSFLNFKGTNAGMRQTIINDAEKFIAYNNGLTITGIDREIREKDGKIYLESINDFQIVNGGQTTASIYFSMKDGLDVSKIKLMAKINIAKDVSDEALNTLISNISKYSNTQTNVTSVDLKTSNKELKLIKKISSSVFAPNGDKWYFDLAKGEFTTLVKLRGSKKKLEKEYPKHRRFTKDHLGKFYTAWGERPYLVKAGGVKVFGHFIKDISGDGDEMKPKEINRDFYQSLIARVILFKELTIIYGAGKNAIGQLRSAVVPYTISVLYHFTNGNKKQLDFDLNILWKNQGLDSSLKAYLYELMILINRLIKELAQSDDFAQYAKKERLWLDIIKSVEIKDFFNNADFEKILKIYGKIKGGKKTETKSNEIYFDTILKTVELASNGTQYYKELRKLINLEPSELNERKFLKSLSLIKMRKDLSIKDIEILEEFIELITSKLPNILDKVNRSDFEDASLKKILDKIILTYNDSFKNNLSVSSEFNKLYEIASLKGVKHSSIFKQIGLKLENNEEISFSDVCMASNYFKSN